jgi:hypothetical protein
MLSKSSIHSWKIHLQCEDSFPDYASFTDLAGKALKRGVKIRIVVNKPSSCQMTRTTAAFIGKRNYEVKFIPSAPLVRLTQVTRRY